MSISADAQSLNQNCVVSILNRTAQVRPDGSWDLPNVPSGFGPVRARATCVEDGVTRSGESEAFTIVAGRMNAIPPIVLGPTTPIPTALTLIAPLTTLTEVGATTQLAVNATYASGPARDVTASAGTFYSTTNATIASVGATGIVNAVRSGTVIIRASNEGTAGLISIKVQLAGDTDGDGIPDDIEIAAGLNPNNPADALEDADRDGLSNRDEFNRGTDIRNADTDGDTISDGEEVVAGADGFITNPLLADTDGDGVRDALEISIGTNPTDATSVNLGAALSSITVNPTTFVITVNSIQGTASIQLTVTGHLRDNTTLDLTARGTNYTSSDLTICNFGAQPGRVFGGSAGSCTVTVANSGFTAQSTGTVNSFTPTPISFVAIPGFANNVDVSGNFAYVAAGASGLQIVSVSNRNVPVIVSALDTPGNANDVRVVGNLAYVADGAAGLQIIDVTSPTTPVLIGSIDTPGDAWDVVVRDQRAYIADGAAGLRIVDVTNPAAPVMLGSIDPPGTQKGVDVDPVRRLAVVASGTSGLHIIDVSTPAAPVLRGSLPGGDVRDVALQDTFAFLADGDRSFTPVDISDPASPILGTSTALSLGGRLNDVAIQNGFAFGADVLFVNGVPIINLDTPSTPVSRAILNFANFRDDDGQGIAADASFVYLAAALGSAFTENGTTGNSRLYIGQYMSLEDRGGIAPTVSITQPSAGAEVIQGSPLSVRATATDDVAVAGVTFTVNGVDAFTDTSEPYEFVATALPLGSVTIGARAIDLGNNVGTAAPVVIQVVPDPLTTVTGRVVDSSGAGIAGATVSVFTLQTQSGVDGAFTIPGVPTVLGLIRATAAATIDGRQFRGSSQSVTPVPGGITDVGTIRLTAFDALYGAAYDGSSGPATFYQIDPATGVATAIGPIGFQRVSAMDAAADGTIYATGRNPTTGRHVLLTINPVTGAGTQIGQTNVETLGFGSTMSDISFRPSDGVLFGYLEAGDGLATINLATGAATAIGSTFVSCCGNGMAFRATGELLHANQSSLHVLNQTTARATVLVGLAYPPAASFGRINAMDFNPQTGELIGSLRGNDSVASFLARINTVTGVVTVIGPTISGLDAVVWGPPR